MALVSAEITVIEHRDHGLGQQDVMGVVVRCFCYISPLGSAVPPQARLQKYCSSSLQFIADHFESAGVTVTLYLQP
jgi:hypothetical protein